MTIAPLTLQQVFDNALNGVRKQGYVPARSPNRCFYLDEQTGRRCAIGHSLPDSTIEQLRKNDGLTNGINIAAYKSPEFKALFSACERGDLNRLQSFHDTLPMFEPNDNAALFEREMAQYAAQRKLTYTPPVAA